MFVLTVFDFHFLCSHMYVMCTVLSQAFFKVILYLTWLSVCIACQCNMVGSTSLQCNETGYCPCHPNVVGMQCDLCQTGFFNFSSHNPDVCEGKFGSTAHIV